MKIAIPVNEKNKNSEVCVSFGRAPYFAVYNTDGEEYIFVNNTAAESQGGAGIKAAQIIIDSGAKVLIAPRQGDNAAKVLNSAAIEVYKNIRENAEENIKAFITGKLIRLNEVSKGMHGKD